MCRNIKPLFNFEPVATDQEVHDAALQYVRKISGYNTPSKNNQDVFDNAVNEIASVTSRLITTLETNTAPRNREIEKQKARERSAIRFPKIS